ncbi:MAG: VOC family protein [Flavobacteriia bacterium]|jgi:catechol 2,3-dioxygenase-like lactoylglutathione lyase family enzyme
MKFRYARHTDQLEKLSDFYTKILGLELLGDFRNHAGYDGIFLGMVNQDWHLEFTQTEELVKHTFDEDDILVFYPANQVEFECIISNLKKHKIEILKAKNPYWLENGICFADPDGYKIVLAKS